MTQAGHGWAVTHTFGSGSGESKVWETKADAQEWANLANGLRLNPAVRSAKEYDASKPADKDGWRFCDVNKTWWRYKQASPCCSPACICGCVSGSPCRCTGASGTVTPVIVPPAGAVVGTGGFIHPSPVPAPAPLYLQPVSRYVPVSYAPPVYRMPSPACVGGG